MTILLLLTSLAVAQQPLQTRTGDATITLGGEVMGRVEFRDDAELSTPGGQSADPMRARGALSLDVDYGAYLGAFVEIMGSWGDTGERSTEDLQQLWLEADQMLGDWRLRLGRTEIELGDGRLMSANRHWLFEPNSFDGAIVSGGSERHDFDWSAWFAEGANGPAALMEDRFVGAYTHVDWSRDKEIEAYAMLRTMDVPDNRQATYALRFLGVTVHGLEWSVLGAHQDGRLLGSGKTWAQALIMNLSKMIDGGHRVGFELGYATGDGLNPGQFGRFDPGYMDQHASNGRADLFAFSNLIDLAFLYGLQWNERWSFHTDFHAFWRASTRDDAFSAFAFAPYGLSGEGRMLGQEIDVYAEGALAEGVGFDFGGAYFLAGSAMPADDDQLWLFARFAFHF